MEKFRFAAIALSLIAFMGATAPAFAFKEGIRKCSKTVCEWEKAPGCHAKRCPIHKVCRKVFFECGDR